MLGCESFQLLGTGSQRSPGWWAPLCLVEDQGVSAEEGEEESDGLWTPVAFIALFLLSLLYSAGVTLLKVR
ncbi:unnamed protein product [Natator depressus]